MKRLVLMIFAVTLVMVLGGFGTVISNAASDNLLEYSISNGEVTITGCDQSAAGELIIPSVIEGYPVTEIGYAAFKKCTGLTDVKIPDSVIMIDGLAFEGCTGLVSVELPDKLKEMGGQAFYGCTSLKSLDYPSGLLEGGWYAFGDCSGLETINFPEGIVSIAYSEFIGCSSLKKLEFPESLVSIEANAFSGCKSIESIDFPEGLKSIDGFAFSDCDSLTEVELPKGLTYFYSDAFLNCDKLTHFDFPECMGSIVQSGFSIYNGLISISLPSSLKSIGVGYFHGAKNLKKVYVSDLEAWCRMRIETFGENSSGSPFCYGAELYLNNELVTELVIPEGVTSIPDSAFYNCSSIKSVKIPDSVTSIGAYAFHGTPFFNDESNWVDGELYLNGHLIAVKDTVNGEYTVKDGTKSIAGGAFNNQTGLTSVSLPEGLSSIGSFAFNGCTGLKKVNIPTSVIKSIGSSAFLRCTGLKEVHISDLEAWCGVEQSRDLFGNGAGLYLNGNLVTELIIPEGVECIAADAFYGNKHITSVTIPSSVKKIDSSAFYGCDGLKEVHISDLETWCGVEWEGYFSNVLFGKGAGLYLNGTLVTELIIPEGVERITANAFYGNKHITSVNIPTSVKSIGRYAFYGCTELKKVHINDLKAWCELEGDQYNPLFSSAVDYYVNGQRITDLVIPEGVKYIGSRRFYNSGITSLTVSGSVEYIGESAFGYCSSLVSIRINEGVKEISSNAFNGCEALENAELPDSLEVIGADIFKGTAFINDESKWDNGALYVGNHLIACDIQKISGGFVVKDGTRTIGNKAFYGAEGLTGVLLPKSLVQIGDSAFENCNNLKNIPIPPSVKRIESCAFYGCKTLDDIDLPNSIEYIGLSAFYNTAHYNNSKNWEDGMLYIGNHLVKADKWIKDECVVKEGTLTIGSEAFHGNRWLTGIIMPDSVRNLNDRVFRYCENLTDVRLSVNLKRIGECAFCRCFALEHIEIPESVEVIDDMAFYVCGSLKDVYYTGNEAKWNEIKIGYDNEYLLNAGIHYVKLGDVDGDEGITSDDAIYLLYSVLFGESEYPLNQKCDFNGDSVVNSDDAIHLLYCVLFGEENYPLTR